MVNYSISLETVEYFMLIMVRISCFVSVAPFFNTANTPGRVKVGFSAFVSLLLFGILPKEGIEFTGMIGYAIIVLKEGITGLLIGFGANICNSIILLAGHLIDLNMGLSMATEYDPTMRTQVSITGNFYSYLLLLLLLITNMHHYILRAIMDSYELIPVSRPILQWDLILDGMLKFMTESFVIAFRITLPVFACIMILNCILGIMAKVSPQMNMFSVGIQLKIMVGMVVILLTIGLLPSVADFIFTEMKRVMVYMIKGMYLN